MGSDREADRIKRELLAREEELLRNETRLDPQRLGKIVEDGCIDVTAAGKISRFKDGSAFKKIDGAVYIESDTAALTDLSGDCKLLVYTGVQVIQNTRGKSIYSSVWRKTDGAWKVLFHQGTSCAE